VVPQLRAALHESWPARSICTRSYCGR
jgi:hypothetical protein